MDFKALDVIESGLYAERIRLNTITTNIANIESYQPNGQPFKELVPVFKAKITEETFKDGTAPVEVVAIKQINLPTQKVYDPENPMADKEGYVEKPNISLVKEMADLITATRTYEANLNALTLNRDLMLKTIEMWG